MFSDRDRRRSRYFGAAFRNESCCQSFLFVVGGVGSSVSLLLEFLADLPFRLRSSFLGFLIFFVSLRDREKLGFFFQF